MTFEDSALWLMFGAGIFAGWWWRGRAERRAHREDLPQWLGQLGLGLVGQFRRVDEGHRFAGDDVAISNVSAYEGGGHSFVVTVRRKQSAEMVL